MYSRFCPLARSCTKFIALHNNNIEVLFSTPKLTDLQRSFDSDGQERNVKVCITVYKPAYFNVGTDLFLDFQNKGSKSFV